MIRQQTIRARDKLVGKLPVTGELLRGTLFERTVRHNRSTKSLERASRKDAGSATVRSGAPDARGASASSNGDTASTVAATREMSEWIAGSASASSPTTSSTSAAS